MWVFKSIIFILAICICSSIRDFVRPTRTFSGFEFGFPLVQNPNPGSRTDKVQTVHIPDFNFFGKPSTMLNVHYNGFISLIGDSSIFDMTCPKELALGKNPLPEDIMAIYWSEYTRGTVHAMTYEAEKYDPNIPNTIDEKFIIMIEAGLKKAFSPKAKDHFASRGIKLKDRTIATITKAYSFTWNNMINGQPGQQPRNHIFQATLVKTKDNLWFLQVYYNPLGARGQVQSNLFPGGQNCQNAQYGIARRRISSTQVINGTISNLFENPAVAQCSTNQYDFTDIGSWVYDLNEGVQSQPSPPSGICDGTMNQDPRCLIQTVGGLESELKQEGERGVKGVSGRRFEQTTQEQEQMNLFCRYRAPGIHDIPSLCDIFVSCSVAGVATVIPCPNGTRFNPEVLNCDHSRQYECFEERFDASGLYSVTQPPSLHDNLCTFEGYGEYVDPLTCTNYYACTNGRSILMPCPEGLFFQPTSNSEGVCDYPRNVQCAGNGKRPADGGILPTRPEPATTTASPESKIFHPRNLY